MADGETSTAVQLQIAFAGHARPGDLGDGADIERKLAEVLKRLRQAGLKNARLLTGLAVGPDKIAAELWRRSGMGPVHAVLPFLNEGGDDVGPTWRRAAMNSCAKSAHVGYLAASSLASARRMQ